MNALFGVAGDDRWDERGRTELDEVKIALRPGAERRTADRLAEVIEAGRRGRDDVFKPGRRPPPARRFRNNSGARTALVIHLRALGGDTRPLPSAPRTTTGLPPRPYRVRSTDNPIGTIEPLRSDYEDPRDVFVLVRGSSTDDRYSLSGWCWGADILDAELPLERVNSMTTLPCDSLKPGGGR